MAGFIDRILGRDPNTEANRVRTLSPDQQDALLQITPATFIADIFNRQYPFSGGALQRFWNERLGGFNADDAQARTEAFYELYHPKGAADSPLAQGAFKETLAKSALGQEASLPLAWTPDEAGQLLAQALNPQGQLLASQKARALLEGGLGPAAEVSFVRSMIQAAGAAVFSDFTLGIIDRKILQVYDEYMAARARGEISGSVPFMTYLIQRAGAFLASYFPGLDPQQLAAAWNQAVQDVVSGKSQAQQPAQNQPQNQQATTTTTPAQTQTPSQNQNPSPAPPPAQITPQEGLNRVGAWATEGSRSSGSAAGGRKALTFNGKPGDPDAYRETLRLYFSGRWNGPTPQIPDGWTQDDVIAYLNENGITYNPVVHAPLLQLMAEETVKRQGPR